jgi:hypothetical protein
LHDLFTLQARLFRLLGAGGSNGCCSFGQYNLNGDQLCRTCNSAQQLQAQCEAQYVFALEGVWLAVDSATGDVVPLTCSAPLCAAAGDLFCPLTRSVPLCIAEALVTGRLTLTNVPYNASAQTLGLVSNYSEAINSCGANRTGFLCGSCTAEYFGVWNSNCVGTRVFVFISSLTW